MTEPNATHQRIIQTALSLFAEHGYSATSINAIAQACQISKGNIFHHFESKEALYLAALKTACRPATHILDQIEQGQIELSFDLLKPFLMQQMKAMFEYSANSYLIAREIINNEANVQQALAQDLFAAHFQKIVRMLEHGKQTNQIKASVDCELAAYSLIGMQLHYFQGQNILPHISSNPLFTDPEAFSQHHYELVLQGIAP